MHTNALSLRFNGHLLVGPGLAGTRLCPFRISLELRVTEVAVATGAIRRAKLQSKCHHQQTDIQFFYRPDALPVAQPTASKHWREKWTPILNCIEKTSTGTSEPWSSNLVTDKKTVSTGNCYVLSNFQATMHITWWMSSAFFKKPVC